MFNNTTSLQKDNKSSLVRLQDMHARGGQPVGGALARAGLVYVHNRKVEQKDKPFFEAWSGGNLAIVHKTRLERTNVKAGIKKPVRGMSSHSKMNLRKKMAMVDVEKAGPFVWASLTYPGKVDQNEKDYRRLANNLQHWIRNHGMYGFIVREWKKRKSGASQGETVPHYHMILWGWLSGISKFREEMSAAWYKMVGSEQESHLKACCFATVKTNVMKQFHYCTKYISKDEKSSIDIPVGAGREWYVIGRDKIAWGKRLEVEITERKAINLFRLGKKYIRSNSKRLKKWKPYNSARSMTLFCNARIWLEKLELVE